MLPNWNNRPITVSYLLNPAFCGEIIKRCIKTYSKENPSDKGLPFILAFTVLPLVLHQDIRNKLPKKTSKSLMSWLTDNQDIKVKIPELIKALVPHTKEAIMFLLAYGVIQINEGGKIEVLEKKTRYKSTGDEVIESFLKSEFMGKWLAKSGTHQSIIISLGIRP